MGNISDLTTEKPTSRDIRCKIYSISREQFDIDKIENFLSITQRKILPFGKTHNARFHYFQILYQYKNL